MPKLAKQLTIAMLQVHTQLTTSREQLSQQHNPEALHDLRVCLRQLRSLLRPLCSTLEHAKDLDALAKQSMEPTNSIRDREVLIIELKHQQLNDLANNYQQDIQASYLDVAEQSELSIIQQQLITVPAHWQRTLSKHAERQLEQHICRQWQKQNHKLGKLIQQDAPDKHRLRILIKQLRYNSETYQAILPKHARKQAQQLKSLQEALGTWHDYFVWIDYAQQHPELESMLPLWQQQLQAWEAKADQALKKFRPLNRAKD